MPSTFVHLRLHTEYSLRDGLLTIPDLLQKAVATGMPAVAITDRHNLYAAVKFYQQAIEAGIKPIIGIDVQCLIDETKPDESLSLTLLCQNNTGYHHLLTLISRAYLEGQINDQPFIKKEWLQDHHDGLIAIFNFNNHETRAKETLPFWQENFSQRFYFEICRVENTNEQTVIHSIIKLAAQYHIPLIATNNVRFLTRDDFEAHEARVCIQEGHTLSDPARPRHYTEEQYFKSPAEMAALFKDIPSALENTVEIAKRCNLHLELNKILLPHFEVPPHLNIETYFCELAKKGLDTRLQALFGQLPEADFLIKRKAYDARLNHELAVINTMGFAGYYLIVADFTKWAKEQDIPVGPGRGSGPGSLVAYALNITDLDPIALDLLFERFLNPERISMPDFDIDFCIEGRDRVIDYVMQTQGKDRVSQIITYGTMAAKAVIRDVGRVLAMPYGFVDKIAKLVPFELGITLEKALEQEPQLQEHYDKEEEVRTLIDLARKLEGLTRNVGKHAGGIVIAPGKLTDFVPLYCEGDDTAHPVTQFDKDDVEAVGLVKFDFLGLKTLTIIHRAVKLVNHRRMQNNESPINIQLLPLDDQKTFALLQACHSTAIFQLESHGMRDLIKRMQPDCFEDLIALVALFRPGPLQSGMADEFINRKSGKDKVTYLHPSLEPVLKLTYGVIVYQEQVMQIARVLAGYTLGAADILRKAMGKKKPEEMAKQRAIFCEGAAQNGVDEKLATHIFDLMEKFAGYAFNKPHAASYALLAYQTAWLKAHYLADFMAAVLSSDMDKTDKILFFLEDCKQLGLTILPPDINHSEYAFTVQDNQTLRYGLGAIKGVGEAVIHAIIHSRKKGGDFLDLFDFCKRIDLKKANRRVLEAFIKAGCFDALGTHRAALLASLDKALQHAEQTLHNATYGQQDLLSEHHTLSKADYLTISPWTEDERLQGEKETLGFYLTGHPLNRYKKELSHLTTCDIASLSPDKHPTATIAGLLTQLRTRQTKRGDKIAIFTLDGGNEATIDVVCFSECYQKYRALLVTDQLIIAEGDVSIDSFNNKPRLVCKDLYSIETLRTRHVQGLQLTLSSWSQLDPKQLQRVLQPFTGGPCPVQIKCVDGKAVTMLSLGPKWQVKAQDALIHCIEAECAVPEIEWMYSLTES